MEKTVKIGHYSIKQSEVPAFNALIAKKGKNIPENQFQRAAIQKGWRPFKSGWPDFLIQKNGKIAFVEVKTNDRQQLKKNQYQIMKILFEHGLECYVWRPNIGFSKFKPYKQDCKLLGSTPGPSTASNSMGAER